MRKLFFLVASMYCTSICFGQSIHQPALKKLMDRASATNSEAIVIYKDGQLIAENYFGIGKAETKIEAMSCTKSIVSLAVACMLSDGLIADLDIPVFRFYPEWKQGQKQLITIRHLLNMTSGLQNNPNASIEIYPSNNFVQLALSAELSAKPGEVWSYNNKSLNLMAGVIQKITGKRMDEYIGERLFKPLGITDYTWSLDSSGNPHVMSGCQIKPADFAKLGLLLLNQGKFQNKEIIQNAHIAQLTMPCEQFKGYGLLWWLEYEQTTTIVDDEIITKLKKAALPDDFIHKVEQIKGIYKTPDEYTSKVESIFGQNGWHQINQLLAPRNLTLRKKEYQGSVKYFANGYLGNYMIVDPKNKLVAVRMISHASFKNDSNTFNDFQSLVQELVKN